MQELSFSTLKHTRKAILSARKEDKLKMVNIVEHELKHGSAIRSMAHQRAFDESIIDLFYQQGFVDASFKSSAKSIPMEKNNVYASLTITKNNRISTVYNEVIKRPNRRGMVKIRVGDDDAWIIGTITKSNIGFEFRGQTSAGISSFAGDSLLSDLV